MGFPWVQVECKKGHRWPMVVAGWWFNLRDVLCPECGTAAVSMKWGGIAEDLRAEVDIEQRSKREAD